MTCETATASIKLFSSTFADIGSIYLFGGEPTLNVEVIEAVCDTLEELYQKQLISNIPPVSFTTNGTRVSDRLISLLKHDYVQVSVSMDGPAEVHNRLRFDARGKGTYDSVVGNVSKMRDETGKPNIIEVAYTSLHLKMKSDIWEIMQRLHEDTKINDFAVTPAFDTSYQSVSYDPLKLDANLVIAQMNDSMERSMDSMSMSPDPIILAYVVFFLKQLFLQQKPLLCPAGQGYFTVSFDGLIYPCQNLPEDSSMLIGYIADTDIGKQLKFSQVRRKLESANEYALKKLGNSLYSHYCKICPAYNLSETGTVYLLSPRRELMYKKLTDTFFEKLKEILLDEERRSQFMRNLAPRWSEIGDD